MFSVEARNLRKIREAKFIDGNKKTVEEANTIHEIACLEGVNFFRSFRDQ